MAKRTTKKQAAAQVAEAPANKPARQSLNRFEISGHVCERGLRIYENGTARFCIGHNMGPAYKDGKKVGERTLFTDIIMFPKNGKKDVSIPADLLVKGKNIIVRGYCKPASGSFTRKDGTEVARRGIEYVALEVVENTEKKSLNSFEITGNVCGRGLNTTEAGTTIFSIGHNMGRDRATLFADLVAFATNGKTKKVEIEEGLVAKSSSVLVRGYRRPNNGERNGRKFYGISFVALEVLPQPQKA